MASTIHRSAERIQIYRTDLQTIKLNRRKTNHVPQPAVRHDQQLYSDGHQKLLQEKTNGIISEPITDEASWFDKVLQKTELLRTCNNTRKTVGTKTIKTLF